MTRHHPAEPAAIPFSRICPAIRIVGVGETGNRLTDALRGAGLSYVVDHFDTQTVPAVTAERFRGVRLVLVLASASERAALHTIPTVANAARAAGALAIGMLTQKTADHFDARQLLAGTGKSLDALIALPPAPAPSLMVALLGAYVAAVVDRRLFEVRLAAPAGTDYLDVRTVFAHAGAAHISIARAEGSERTARAADDAIAGMGEARLRDAVGALILVAGSRSLRLREIAAVTDIVDARLAPHCNVKLVVHYDERLDDELRVTLIAAAQRT